MHADPQVNSSTLKLSDGIPSKVLRNKSDRLYSNAVYDVPPGVTIRVNEEEALRLLNDLPKVFEEVEDEEAVAQFDIREIRSGKYRHRAILEVGTLTHLQAFASAVERGAIAPDGTALTQVSEDVSYASMRMPATPQESLENETSPNEESDDAQKSA